MKPNVEILAPAGSWESMAAAINAGADAVYMGGSRFGARAYADNPEEDRFLEAIDYVHLHGRRLYMTVNTLVKEQELDALGEFLVPYYERGLDAVIVQDLGVFSYIRRRFPDLPIHASTQMTVTGYHGARMLRQMGAARVVTARELSLEELARIRDEVDIEIESFVHGALCYCYSGQCLLSSLIGGRSGNRGRCAQPCRLPYDVRRDGAGVGKPDERYVMSLKDLCTLDILPDIIEAGVCSLKIEGRMKSPRYTAGVVSIYRKYVDACLEHGRKGYRVEPDDRRMLLELFDRGGFTDGYYRKQNGRDMVALQEKPAFREGNQALFARLDAEYVEKKNQIPITGTVIVNEGEPARLELVYAGSHGDIRAEAVGGQVQSAQNQPLTSEKLLKQMTKTGNTPFVFAQLKTELARACFLPVQAINELRRSGLEALTEAMLSPYRRELRIARMASAATVIDTGADEAKAWKLHVSLEEAGTLQTAIAHPDVTAVYLDAAGFGAESWADAVKGCHDSGKQCALVLPHIFRAEADTYFRKHHRELMEAGFDELVVRSLEEVDFLKEQSIRIPMVFDSGMYVMNHLAMYEMRKLGAVRLTLPLELNGRELEALGCRYQELIAYGYLPAMVSAQCIRRTVGGCSRTPELLWMKDRTGKELPVKNHCRFCYNTVYNPTPLSLLGLERMVQKLEPAVLRLSFTIETPQQVKAVVDAYAGHFLYGQDSAAPCSDFTRGHMKRGVE